MTETAIAGTPPPWPGGTEAHRIFVEPMARRVRVVFQGRTIADSRRPLLMMEHKLVPVYYFPPADVDDETMSATEHGTHCPFKGDAAYWTVEVDGRAAENAVWAYPSPVPGMAAIKDHRAFYWDKMDHWYEEDEEVFVHARDPYKRIDVVESHRPVEVVLGGEVVAASSRARFLYETGMPLRFYLPAEDVRMDLLAPSDRRTACPYKGEAVYWRARVGEREFEDIVWSYPEPLPETGRIKDYLCFFNEQVDEIRLEGETVPKLKTKWSPKD